MNTKVALTCLAICSALSFAVLPFASLPRVLNTTDARAIRGHGPEDPCLFRIVTTQCSAAGYEPGVCAGNPDLPEVPQPGEWCIGDCALGYVCDGENMHSTCRTASAPGLPLTLSACSDNGTVTCGQAWRGAGPCSVHFWLNPDLTVADWECRCPELVLDPDTACEDVDIDNIEDDCEGGSAPV